MGDSLDARGREVTRLMERVKYTQMYEAATPFEHSGGLFQTLRLQVKLILDSLSHQIAF